MSYKNAYNSCFQHLPDMSLWPAYTNSDVYGCPTKWWMGIDRRKSVDLHNEMNVREGNSLNRYDIYSQMSHIRKNL